MSLLVRLKRIKIRTILLVLLISSIAIFAIIIFSYYISMNSAYDVDKTTLNAYNSIGTINNLRLLVCQIAMPPNDYLITWDKGELANFKAIDRKIKNFFRSVNIIINKEKHKKMLRQVIRSYNEFKGLAYEIFKMSEGSDGKEIMKEMDSIANKIVDNLGKIRVGILKEMENNVHKAEKQYRLQYLIIQNIAIGTAIIFILLFLLAMRPIKKMKHFIQEFTKFARGDLTVDIKIDRVKCWKEMRCNNKECQMYENDSVNMCFFEVGSYAPLFDREVACPDIKAGKFASCDECPVMKAIVNNEIDMLGVWLKLFVDSLKYRIVKIKEAASSGLDISKELSAHTEETSAAIEEINQNANSIRKTIVNLLGKINENARAVEKMVLSTDAISDGIERQTQAVDKISAVVEQINSGLITMARNTIARQGEIEVLLDTVKVGASKLEEASQGIEEMIARTKGMLDIINIISDIAEKTNLLAMNAKIEAAHAGDYGTGFAVVADEIRGLADNVRTNTKKITEEIKSSIEAIRTAAQKSGDAERTFKEINQEMMSVLNAIMEMINGINEMSEGSKISAQALAKILDITDELNNTNNIVKESGRFLRSTMENLLEASNVEIGAVEEIMNAIEQVSKSMESIVTMVNSNEYISKTIIDSLSYFKIEEEGISNLPTTA